MIRVYGPYKHGDRWRLAYRALGSLRLRYRSFLTREDAEQTGEAEIATMAEAALARVANETPVDMPDDPVWIYMLHDDTDTILYVGVTRHLDGRRYDHRESGVSFSRMSFYPRPFDRVVGLAVEAALIRKYSPVLNRAGVVENNLETDRYVPRTWKSPGEKT